MLWLALGLILLALVLLRLAGRQQRKSGLPGGRVIYADTGEWRKNSQALYDPKLDLAGKPDYLVYHQGVPVPVEVKTGRTPPQPYDSHIFQLAAYCYLVEHLTGKRPAHGILHYPRQTFEIPYTEELQEALQQTLTEMRAKAHQRSPLPPSHHHPARCAGCAFRNTCDQRLR